MSSFRFRRVREDDAVQILAVYAPYIIDSAVSFEYEVPSESEFKQRIRTISAEYPYFVCVSDDQIIGYAYAHRHMERAERGDINIHPARIHRERTGKNHVPDFN